jgi:hypothetical protein
MTGTRRYAEAGLRFTGDRRARAAVSSTQHTSAEWSAAHHRRGAQRASLNYTTVTWRLKLKW